MAKTLVQGQTLTKCPSCTRPSVMEKNIGQCQNPNCGYIFCSICLSFSVSGPEDFQDRCKNSQLVVNKTRRSSRFGLSDLSNSGLDSEHSTFFTESSHTSKTETSGYVSDIESPINRVKRNLNGRFSVDKTNVFSENNRNTPKIYHHKRRRPSLVPVVSCETKEILEISEPPSPPKVEAVAGSKQSKKNLRRLLLN